MAATKQTPKTAAAEAMLRDLEAGEPLPTIVFREMGRDLSPAYLDVTAQAERLSIWNAALVRALTTLDGLLRGRI